MDNPRRTRLILVLLVLISFTLVTLDLRSGSDSAFAGLRSVTSTVLGPVQRALSSVVDPIRNAAGGFGSDADELDRLRKENEQLTKEVRSNALDAQTADQLRQLELLAGAGQYEIVPAEVVGVGGALGFEWTATIDVGSRDGIEVGQTVATGYGLVGRITVVGRSVSKVLLAIDPTSGVGAQLAGTDEIGTVTGNGTQPMVLQLLDANAQVAKGDRLVTGPGGVSSFAPGIPIGVVSKPLDTPGALTRSAEVTPYVDFTALHLVGVVIDPPRTDPRDTVLQVLPTPSPAATPAPGAPAPATSAAPGAPGANPAPASPAPAG